MGFVAYGDVIRGTAIPSGSYKRTDFNAIRIAHPTYARASNNKIILEPGLYAVFIDGRLEDAAGVTNRYYVGLSFSDTEDPTVGSWLYSYTRFTLNTYARLNIQSQKTLRAIFYSQDKSTEIKETATFIIVRLGDELIG